MKRLLKTALMTLVFAILLCVGALATNGESGIYALTAVDGIEVEAQLANGTTVDPASATLTKIGAVTDYCENAVKVEVTYSGAKSGEEYLLFALNDGKDIPTDSNIAYIDQQSGKAIFTVYPILEDGKTYTVYLVSNGTFEKKPVASFKYHSYVPYVLGDANQDGEVMANDATMILRHIAKIEYMTSENALLASDINKNGGVDANDATKLLRYIAKIDSSLE